MTVIHTANAIYWYENNTKNNDPEDYVIVIKLNTII